MAYKVKLFANSILTINQSTRHKIMRHHRDAVMPHDFMTCTLVDCQNRICE